MRYKGKKLIVAVLTGLLVAGLGGCAAVEETLTALEETAAALEGTTKTGETAKRTAAGIVIDEYEPNDNLLQPTMIAMNSTTQATIEPAGDVDVYKVHLASNKREVIVVTLLNPTTHLEPVLEFYTANRERFWHSDRYPQAGIAQVSGQIISPPNQDYFIKVYESRGDARSPEYYTLDVRLAGGVADQYEPNDSLEGATLISLGETQGSINPQGDVDCYRIRLTSGGTVRVTFLNPTLNLEPVLEFYTANRERFWHSDRYPQAGIAQVAGQFDAQPNQDYFIKVYESRGDAKSAELYTLRIELF